MFADQMRAAMAAAPRRTYPQQSNAQLHLPLSPRVQPRQRRRRATFRPRPLGPYRLPREAQDRLESALQPYRNAEAAFALAVLLGRFWSVPGRLVGTFPIDRRALADHPELGLTEARVRGAIKALEEVGFLDRAVTGGRTHKLTAQDELHRKPILFQFGTEYAPIFIRANHRNRAGHRPTPRQPFTSSPKGSAAKRAMLMGEIKKKGLGDRRGARPPEFRLASRAAIRRAAEASLEALVRLPLPRLSDRALATTVDKPGDKRGFSRSVRDKSVRRSGPAQKAAQRRE